MMSFQHSVGLKYPCCSRNRSNRFFSLNTAIRDTPSMGVTSDNLLVCDKADWTRSRNTQLSNTTMDDRTPILDIMKLGL